MKGGDIVIKQFLLVIFDEDHNVKENLFFDNLKKLEEKLFSYSNIENFNDKNFDIYSLLDNDELGEFMILVLKRLKNNIKKN